MQSWSSVREYGYAKLREMLSAVGAIRLHHRGRVYADIVPAADQDEYVYCMRHHKRSEPCPLCAPAPSRAALEAAEKALEHAMELIDSGAPSEDDCTAAYLLIRQARAALALLRREGTEA